MPERILRMTGLVLAAILAAACGSSSATLTGPAPVKCSVDVSLGSTSIGPGGGKDTATVSAARECAWSAAPDASWISITSGRSGQGDGTIDYLVSANATARPRTGGIVVNDIVSELTQEGSPCTFALDRTGTVVGALGGVDRVSVSAPAGCAWTAESQTPWLTVVNGQSGSGPGTVDVQVESNPSATARSGVVLIAGQTFDVQQVGVLSSCGVTLTPSSAAVPAAGGSVAVTLTTGVGCPWNASPSVAWLSTQPPSGSGPGLVDVSAAANTSGIARVGTVSVAGTILTIDQAGGGGPACTYGIQPTAASIGVGGGTIAVTVQAPAGCAWSAASNDTWISLISGQSGSGTGTVQVSVAPYLGLTPRVGTATIAGRTLTVMQRGLLAAVLESHGSPAYRLAGLR